MTVPWWYRVFVLRSPHGAWESLLVVVGVYAGFVVAGLVALATALFVGCGPGLCGFFS